MSRKDLGMIPWVDEMGEKYFMPFNRGCSRWGILLSEGLAAAFMHIRIMCSCFGDFGILAPYFNHLDPTLIPSRSHTDLLTPTTFRLRCL